MLFCVSFIFRIHDFDMRLSIDLDMFMRRLFEILVKKGTKDVFITLSSTWKTVRLNM